MSTKTTNYNMVLPSQDDYYNVDIFNENYKTIDDELKRLSDVQDDLANVAEDGNYNSLDYKPFKTCATATELSAAISALSDSGGVIYLLPGTFDFTNINLTVSKNNITICGSGAGTVIKLGATQKISITGNNIKLKSLNIIREAEDSTELILLDSDGDGGHNSENFELDGVFMVCPTTSAANGLIRCTVAMSGTRLISCTLSSYTGNLLYSSSTITSFALSGIINNCIVFGSLIVPVTMTLGVNSGITQEV